MILPVVVAFLAAMLLWLWWSDSLLKRDCARAGGQWNAEARVCMIGAGDFKVPAAPASPPR